MKKKKEKKVDYILETTIVLCNRIKASNFIEARNLWHKELKIDLKTERIDYLPAKRKIKLVDIVLNRENNKIYGNDVSILNKKKN